MQWRLHTFEDVSSTQDSLKEIIKILQNDDSQGFCVQAIRQGNGRGRHGRVWHDGAGNLMMSFALKAAGDLSRVGEISLLCGLAVAKTLAQEIDKDKIILKWPNDVLVSGRKISGLLIEVEGEYLIIGLGVNIAVAPYENSVCLKDLSEAEYTPETVRDAFLEQFEELYSAWKNEGFSRIRGEYLSYAPLNHSKITVKMPSGAIVGQFETIDESGNLIIRDGANELVKVSSGEVFLNN